MEDNSALALWSQRAGRHGLAARRRIARPAKLAQGAVGLMLNEVLPMKINEVVGLRAHCARDSRERNLDSSARGPIRRAAQPPNLVDGVRARIPPASELNPEVV